MHEIGFLGLGPMGAALAANAAERGFRVFAWDRDYGAKIEQKALCGISVLESIADVISSLIPPRRVVLLIRSGPAVDEVLQKLLPLLQTGDTVLDCGNSHYRDTTRRQTEAEARKIGYLGIGLSGGPAGARNGPAIMGGGNRLAWDHCRPFLEPLAARSAEGGSCCSYIGTGGSGHFVKTIHNGIEYAVMQLLLEAYALFQKGCQMGPAEISQMLNGQLGTPADTYLTAATAAVLAETDVQSGNYFIDIVDGSTEQKGTGRWAVQAAVDLGVAAPTLAEAVMYRDLSVQLQNTKVSRERHQDPAKKSLDRDEIARLVTNLPHALGLGFLSAFGQGLDIIRAGSEKLGWRINLRNVVGTWRHGSVLQSQIVNTLHDSLGAGINAGPFITTAQTAPFIQAGRIPLREMIGVAARAGTPSPGLASALSFVESVTGNALPTGLLQLQRNYFGGHEIRRKDTLKPLATPWHTKQEQS